MTLVTIVQESLNAGELSPDVYARVGLADYAQGGRIVENMISLPEGPLMRRSGTRYIATAKATSASFLIPFEFSEEVDQTYVFEAGDQYFRVYKDRAQITVADTDASVSNGTFDSDTTDWDDRSTGSTTISHEILNAGTEGTFDAPNAANEAFGDANANALNVGLKFNNTNAGDVSKARIEVSAHTATFNAVARIYTDSSGSPGTQVGGDSATVSLDSTGIKEFTWSTKPSISAATDYWLIISDTTGGGTGNIQIRQCNDQGSSFASGKHDTITSIVDGGNIPAGLDFRMEVTVEQTGANGALALNGDGTDIAWAEQDITTTNTGQETVVKFRVIGAAGDLVEFRIGNTSTGDQILEDVERKVGYHTVAFTPDASPFYIQFRNKLNKTVYIDDVEIIDNAPLEISTPYLEADLTTIQKAQSFDVIYLTNGFYAGSSSIYGYPVYRLERRGDTTWSLVEVDFQDGPYFTENTTTTTLQPSSTAGNGVTVTASEDLFDSDEWIGRLLRIDEGSDFGWGIIVDRAGKTEVSVDIKDAFVSANTRTTWRLGVYSDATGWPKSVSFHEQRLAFAGAAFAPGRVDLSKIGEFTNFAPGADDDDAIGVVIDADQSPAIQWLASANGHLFAGALGRFYSVEPDTSGGALTPSARIEAHATKGSEPVQPIIAGSDLLFVERHGKRIRAIEFDVVRERFLGKNRTRLSGHVGADGLTQLAFQQEPYNVVWAVRGDGQLVGFSYEADEEPDGRPIVGAHRHIMGPPDTGTADVKAITVIAGAAGDEAWALTQRTIDGGSVRFIEILEDPYDRDDDAAKDAFFLDAALDFSGTLTSVTVAHLANEDALYANADGTKIGPLSANGSGVVSLGATYSDVVIGLRHTWKFQPMRVAPTLQSGNTLGKVKQINSVDIDVEHSGDIEFGVDSNNLVAFNLGGTEPFSGVPVETNELDAPLEKTADIIFQGDGILPVKLRALMLEVEVNERGTPT